MEFEFTLKSAMELRPGDKEYAATKEQLRKTYESVYHYDPNKNFEDWFARLTQTGSGRGNSKSEAQWAYVEMILAVDHPYTRPIPPEVKRKNELDYLTPGSVQAGGTDGQATWSKKNLEKIYGNVYKDKGFEDWYTRVTGNNTEESEGAIQEFRDKQALEQAISDAELNLALAIISVGSARSSGGNRNLGIVPGKPGKSVGTGKPTAPKVTKPAGGTGNHPSNFADRAKLESHFDKHGGEFGGIYKNADEYLDGAKNVINSGIKVQYEYKGETRTGYVKFMGNNKDGNAKFEFVGTNNNGEITTYHTQSGKKFWKTINGENVPVINPAE